MTLPNMETCLRPIRWHSFCFLDERYLQVKISDTACLEAMQIYPADQRRNRLTESLHGCPLAVASIPVS